MENEKRGISQITGKTEIKLGEKAFYKVARIHRMEDHDKVKNALWKIYVKEKGNWRELKPNPSAPQKKGDEIPLTISNQSLVGKELLVEAYIYEAEMKAPPGLKIKVVPGTEKKITAVELFMVDDTPIKEDTILKYNQTIKVKVYTQNMPRELLKLTLYEDDAEKGGHNPNNEKNKVAETKKATNDKGFLWYEFKLNAEFSKIANAMKDGVHDKLHEYYVLVESVKYGNKTSKNVEVENPDYTVHQTYENGKVTDHKKDKIYEGGVIEEVIIKGKYKKQMGIDPIQNTGRTVSIVQEPPEKKEEKEKCFCNRDFEEKDVRKLVKLLKGTETIWEGQALKGGKRAECNISDKSFGTLTKELNNAIKKYKINTCAQKMHFLAQVCEETGTFALSEETKSKYASSTSVYKGRGLLQLTGVKKEGEDSYDSPGPYKDYADYKGDQRIVKTPEIVANNVHYCIDSGAWIWSVNKKMTNNPKSAAIIKWGNETLGKSLNELAVYVDKYLELISVLLNGRNSETGMPNGWAIRQSNYNTLKNFFFMYDRFHGDNHKPADAEDIVTYHIYANGEIEKHIPKSIKSGYEKKYAYIYHDKSGSLHELGTYDIIPTQVYGGVKGTKVNLINLDKVKKSYKKENYQYTFNVDSPRKYVNEKTLASIFGAMLEVNYNDISCNGFSHPDGSSKPSVSHINGNNGDFKYLRKDKKLMFGDGTSLDISANPDMLDDVRQNKWNDALYKFGWKSMLGWTYKRNGKVNYLNHLPKNTKNHHHHLHVQGYKPSFKEIKK